MTEVFDAHDDYVTRDSVFGVKQSLIRTYEDCPRGTPTPDGRTLDCDWSQVRFDIVLAPEAEAVDPQAEVEVVQQGRP